MAAADRFVRLVLSAKDDTSASFTSVKDKLSDLSATVARTSALLGGLGAGLSFAGLAASVKTALDSMDELAKSAERIGVSTETLSGLRYAAELSGIGIDELQTALTRLSMTLINAQAGSSDAAKAFRSLNIDPKQFRSADEALLAIADAFARMPDGAAKASLAIDLFSRGGAQMVTLLNHGSDGLRQMLEEARRFGAVIDQESAEAAERFNDQLTRLQTSLRGLAVSAAKDVLPALNEITQAMTEAASDRGPLFALLVGFGGAIDQLINGSELSRLRKRKDELEASLRDIREVVRTGILPADQIPFLPPGLINGIKLNQRALDDWRRSLEKHEDELRSINDRIQALIAPPAGRDKDQRIEREIAYRQELEATTKELDKQLKERQKDYQELAEAIRKAMDSALRSEQEYLRQAKALRKEAAGAVTVDDSIESQASAMLDLIVAEQKLQRLRSADTSIETVQEQVALIRELAARVDDQARAKEAVRTAALIEAEALERAAAAQREQADALDEQGARTQALIRGLRDELEALQAQTPTLKVEVTGLDEARAKVAQLRRELEAMSTGVSVPVTTLSGVGTTDITRAAAKLGAR